MDFYLVGFFPKFRVTRENWDRQPNASGVFPASSSISQIASVSNCIVKGLAGFDYPQYTKDSFNQYGGFNQLDAALAAIQLHGTELEFDLFAYAIPEQIYDDGQLQEAEIGCVEIDEVSDFEKQFEKLGFDVVEMQNCSFGCSPLTCNGQSGLHLELLNEFNLIQSEFDADKLAKEFSISKPEPGPYVVVEVWRYTHTPTTAN